MHRRVRCRAGQPGLSLVELLIGMFLGLLLIGAALSMVVATSRSRGTLDALARTQEAGRFALLLLARDARMAGYRGCAYGAINSLLNPTGYGYSDAVYDFGTPFFGWSQAGVPLIPAGTLPADFAARYLRGDVLVVRNAATSLGIGLAADVTTDSDFVQSDTAIVAPVGSLVLVSDCGGGGDLFQVTTDEPSPTDRLERNASLAGIGPGNLDPSLHLFSRLYPVASTELLHARSNVYYVGRAQTIDGRLIAGSSLRRIRMGERIGGAPPDDELVSGVYDLRVQYGVDLSGNGGVDEYLGADALTAAAWEGVVAVRLSILAYGGEGTAESVADTAHPVPFDETIWDLPAGQVVPDADGAPGELLFLPPDRRIYRFFSTTVAVRNRAG